MGSQPNDSLIHPMPDRVAIQRGVAIRTMVALAWLLRRSKVILPIPEHHPSNILKRISLPALLNSLRPLNDYLSAVSHPPASLRS
jgi:hypothetical protein